MVSCQEVIKLHSMAEVQIVAGAQGLDRLVRWVHFIDLPDVLPWVQGGELLIITGIGLQGKPEELKRLVQGLIDKKLAGMIINLGPYIESVPDDVITIAEAANFPLFTLPWKVKLVGVMQEICSYIVMQQTEKHSISSFFEQLLLKPVAAEQELMEHAAVYGYDLSQSQQVVVISAILLTEQKLTRKNAKHNFVLIKTQLEQFVRDFFVMRGQKILLTLWMDKVLFLLPENVQDEKKNCSVVQLLVDQLGEHFTTLNVAAGIGSPAPLLQNIRESYLQANKALWFAESLATKQCVYTYESLGIYKLLFEIPLEKLQAYCEEIIGTLKEHDQRYKMNLVNSLFVYFEENGNVVKTSKRLFVHRNTLDYRLKKIEDVSGKKLANSYDRLMLQLGVIIARQIGGGHNKISYDVNKYKKEPDIL